MIETPKKKEEAPANKTGVLWTLRMHLENKEGMMRSLLADQERTFKKQNEVQEEINELNQAIKACQDSGLKG